MVVVEVVFFIVLHVATGPEAAPPWLLAVPVLMLAAGAAPSWWLTRRARAARAATPDATQAGKADSAGI